MSLCIIKYTYTRYVGVDIEKYTRGLFEYVKEALKAKSSFHLSRAWQPIRPV